MALVIKTGIHGNLGKRVVGQGNLAASKLNAKFTYIFPNGAAVMELEHTGEMNRIDADRFSDAIERQFIKTISFQEFFTWTMS